MKHLGLAHIILVLGVGALLLGTADGDLTAYQSLMPSSEVGQMVMVTVSLTYNGVNSTQAMVTPNLPPGIVANDGGQSLELYPGVPQQVSYSLIAQQSGNYWIVSDIDWDDGGAWRSLRLEEPFTAIESSAPGPQGDQPFPGGQESGAGSDPFVPPIGGAAGNGEYPPGEGVYNGTQDEPGSERTGSDAPPGQE